GVAHGSSDWISGRVTVADGSAEASARANGEIGIGPRSSNPNGPGWNWYRALRDVTDATHFVGQTTRYMVGEFDIAFRFSTDEGETFTLCDRSPEEPGYQPSSAGTLYVHP